MVEEEGFLHMTSHHLACDLGAESGRVMLGTLTEGKLAVEEIHRFPNPPLQQAGQMCWDIATLFGEIKTGLIKAASRKLPVASISTDSWGVDYILRDASGVILAPTFHYRDRRTAEGVKRAYAKTDWNTVFDETGIQFMPINTIFQLAAETPERLAKAHQLLNIGDAFNFLLSGVARAEQSLASTTQLYNPRTRTWSKRLIDVLGLPPKLFPPIVASGTRLGSLRPELARETGLPESVEVIATCSHDTGCAVAAVPVSCDDWAYLSSGTWSLMGIEIPEPVITDASRDLNFTNEIGCGGTVRFLKNIVGLWLIQECRRNWAQAGHNYDYNTLTQLAAGAPAFVSLIDPADPRFMSPNEMPEKIAAYCRESGQPVPADAGSFVRCILESLALFYRYTLRQVEQLTGRRIQRLHVVGGGSRNPLLNQFIANALGIPVIAGPAEASSMGNLLIQAMTLGRLASLPAAREVVRHSSTIETLQPQDAISWQQAYVRFEKLVAGK
jgi:rhamnulokinase